MIGVPGRPMDLPDAGIAEAVRHLIERIARERPGALDDGTLYDRVIGEVERPLIEAMLADTAAISYARRGRWVSTAIRCASDWIRWGSAPRATIDP